MVEILVIQCAILSGDASLLSAVPEIPPNFDFVSALQSTLLFSPKIAPNSVISQLRELILDFFCPAEGGSFIPLYVKRSNLLAEARLRNSFDRLDEAMGLNYEAEIDRMGREKIVPNLGSVNLQWIIVEIAYDRNSGVFCIGRKSGQDDESSIVFPPEEIVVKIESILASFEALLLENDKSFYVSPESKNSPEYVKKWWDERKRIDSGMEKIVQKLYTEVFAPYSFLFKLWKRGNEMEEVIREILQCIDSSSSIVSTFLHCNETPLTVESFASLLSLLGVSPKQSVSFSLLQKYNRFLHKHSDKIELILVLSPSLQNLPFESMPCFSVSTHSSTSIYRHFCLQSISDCALPRETITLSPGQYVLNISYFWNSGIPSPSRRAICRRRSRSCFQCCCSWSRSGGLERFAARRLASSCCGFDGIRSCREAFRRAGYLYCGHGSGAAYCSHEAMLEGPPVRAVAFLMGCSSVRLGTVRPRSGEAKGRSDRLCSPEGSGKCPAVGVDRGEKCPVDDAAVVGFSDLEEVSGGIDSNFASIRKDLNGSSVNSVDSHSFSTLPIDSKSPSILPNDAKTHSISHNSHSPSILPIDSQVPSISNNSHSLSISNNSHSLSISNDQHSLSISNNSPSPSFPSDPRSPSALRPAASPSSLALSAPRRVAAHPSLTRVDTALYFLAKQTPAVLGCLWDVSDGDLDRITHRLLSHFLQTNTAHDLSQLALRARAASLLRSLVGAALVVYGLPAACRLPPH